MKNEKQFIKFLRKCLIGLKILHTHKYIHRDIKPDNILYDEKTDDFYIGDLGLVISEDEIQRSLNGDKKQILAGTKAYIPPKLIKKLRKNKIPVDVMKTFAKWDVYSLGLTAEDKLEDLLHTKPSTKFLELADNLITEMTSERMSILEALKHDLFSISL